MLLSCDLDRGNMVWKKVNKRKFGLSSTVPQPHHQQQQILISPNIAQNNGQQFVAIGQLPQPSNMVSPQVIPQNMIINPPNQQMVLANGTLMAVPQNQGIMYQQLPDGTLLQVASQMPMIQQQGQQIMTAPPVQGQVMVTAGGQLIHGGGPQLVMTPQGLMQTVGPAVAGINNPNIGTLTEQKKPNKKKPNKNEAAVAATVEQNTTTGSPSGADTSSAPVNASSNLNTASGQNEIPLVNTEKKKTKTTAICLHN